MLVALALAAVAASGASASGGLALTPVHRAQLQRFVTAARGVETKLDGYSRVWGTLPDALPRACSVSRSRAALAAFVKQAANQSLAYVHAAERGEVALYGYSQDLAGGRGGAGESAKRRYVQALDAVGKDFDRQLEDGRDGLKIGGLIDGNDCGGAAVAAPSLGERWTQGIEALRGDLAELQRGWGA